MQPNLAAQYDCVVPWERRLKREMGLLEAIACGIDMNSSLSAASETMLIVLNGEVL